MKASIMTLRERMFFLNRVALHSLNEKGQKAFYQSFFHLVAYQVKNKNVDHEMLDHAEKRMSEIIALSGYRKDS